METGQKTPYAESLRQMSYSELKKIAKKHGIKGNLKAGKIIAALTSVDSNDRESFSTPAQKTINSSRKNKEEKFNGDRMTPLVTSRRGTYSVGSPISRKAEDNSVVIDTSVLEMSNVTVGRGSERKLRPRKVSFMSPIMTPRTPKNSSIKLRPKTPVASYTSLGKKVSPSSVRQLRGNLHRSVSKSSHMTSQPQNSISKADTSKTVNAADTSENNGIPLPQITQNNTSSAKSPQNDAIKSNSIKSVMPKDETSDRIKQMTTPRSLVFKDETSTKIKRIATPNFKRIHEKAFEKMESIDDYHKRKMNSAKKVGRLEAKVMKAKSKIPAFSGIPFVPSASTRAKLNHDLKMSNHIADKKKVECNTENVLKKSKSKFDLKASLSRKLGYKPYTGPLKPLTESNVLNTSSAACFHNVKEPVNKVVSSNRLQNRGTLKGVRTNKRFELQMKNRRLE